MKIKRGKLILEDGKYDWWKRFDWLGYIRIVNKKLIIRQSINIYYAAAVNNLSTEEYMAKSYDEKWLTGQAKLDTYQIITAGKTFKELLNETKDKNKV